MIFVAGGAQVTNGAKSPHSCVRTLPTSKLPKDDPTRVHPTSRLGRRPHPRPLEESESSSCGVEGTGPAHATDTHAATPSSTQFGDDPRAPARHLEASGTPTGDDFRSRARVNAGSASTLGSGVLPSRIGECRRGKPRPGSRTTARLRDQPAPHRPGRPNRRAYIAVNSRATRSRSPGDPASRPANAAIIPPAAWATASGEAAGSALPRSTRRWV